VAQNSPYLWKHTCNCGAAEMVVQDDNLNAYVITDASLNLPNVIKISPSGQEKWKYTYLPAGYTSMRFTNSFYLNGGVYLAGYAENSTLSHRLFVMKIDTSGIVVNQIVVDSVQANTIYGVKSAPYYNYGFFRDQTNAIHVGFIKTDSNFNSNYSFLKFDLNFSLIGQFDSPFNYPSGPMYVSESGNVYFQANNDLHKLNSNYTALDWSYTLPSGTIGNMIAADASANIYLLKNVTLWNTNDFSLLKLHDNGVSYTFQFDQPVASMPSLYMDHILLDSTAGSIYVAGGTYTGWPVVKYIKKLDTSNGSIVWQDSSYDNRYNDLIIGQQNNLIALGGGDKFYVTFYNSAGSPAFVYTYDTPCGGNDGINAAVFEHPDKLIVTGTACENSSTINWATTLKYTVPVITGLQNTLPENENLNLFPVPAKDKLYINAIDDIKEIQAIDLNGQVIPLIFNSDNSIGISELAGGSYILQITTSQFTVQSRFVVSP
jgi:hypothetical protein